MTSSMADSPLIPPASEMSDMFLDGTESSYQLFIAASKMPEAGLGLYAREEIPAGKEIFRAPPFVSAV